MKYKFIGVDVETSGTDHIVGTPIQIGIAAPDGSTYTSLIGGWDWTQREWNLTSETIHGIPQTDVHAAPHHTEVDHAAAVWLQQHVPTGTRIMIGWNVGAFDRPYITKWLPTLDKLFIRRTADFNAICFACTEHKKRSYERVKRETQQYANLFIGGNEQRHDAGVDATAAIHEFAYLQHLINGTPLPPAPTP